MTVCKAHCSDELIHHLEHREYNFGRDVCTDWQIYLWFSFELLFTVTGAKM